MENFHISHILHSYTFQSHFTIWKTYTFVASHGLMLVGVGWHSVACAEQTWN
jgi:hypothetical protein